MKVANFSAPGRYLFSQAGFTLVEIITAMVVAGILLVVAVPAFKDVISNSRLTTDTNAFISALNLARSEAVTRGVRVSLCRSSDGATCNTATGGWEGGWIIFSEPDPAYANGTFNGTTPSPDEEILRVYSPLDGGVTLRSSSSVYSNFISFSSVGSGVGGASNTDNLRLCDARGASKAYEIDISATGRVSSKRGTTTCP